jgi:hypothetical protein
VDKGSRTRERSPDRASLCPRKCEISLLLTILNRRDENQEKKDELKGQQKRQSIKSMRDFKKP